MCNAIRMANPFSALYIAICIEQYRYASRASLAVQQITPKTFVHKNKYIFMYALCPSNPPLGHWDSHGVQLNIKCAGFRRSYCLFGEKLGTSSKVNGRDCAILITTDLRHLLYICCFCVSKKYTWAYSVLASDAIIIVYTLLINIS